MEYNVGYMITVSNPTAANKGYPFSDKPHMFDWIAGGLYKPFGVRFVWRYMANMDKISIDHMHIPVSGSWSPKKEKLCSFSWCPAQV